ncbi:MAG: hypothetical protein RL308_2730 [Bacteroidota bacterium]|jgi:type I restriction enzyme S subunit
MEKLMPKLRFPEFEEKWLNVKLKDISKYFNGGSFENHVIEEGKYELITLKSVDMSGNLAHSNRFLDIEVETLKRNTLIMILSEQSPGLLGMTALIPTDDRYVLNQRVAEIRPSNDVHSYFLSLAINRNQTYFSKLGAGTKVQNITKPNVENYEFFYPTLAEQTKIATFLSAVDEKINLLREKKAALEDYKKGMMQKIFSQEIRFKDDNGNDFAEWEEKYLADICSKKSSNISANKIEDNHGEFIIYGASGVLKKVDFYQEENDYVSIVKDGAGAGRLLYCKGKSSVLGTLEILSPKVNLHTYFLYCLLSNIDFVKYVAGSTIPHIYFKDYSLEKCGLPCMAEQTKIATFLSAIDEKIELVTTQIEETQEYKKGLLQQMFC